MIATLEVFCELQVLNHVLSEFFNMEMLRLKLHSQQGVQTREGNLHDYPGSSTGTIEGLFFPTSKANNRAPCIIAFFHVHLSHSSSILSAVLCKLIVLDCLKLSP